MGRQAKGQVTVSPPGADFSIAEFGAEMLELKSRRGQFAGNHRDIAVSYR
jgi:hypothetical protein